MTTTIASGASTFTISGTGATYSLASGLTRGAATDQAGVLITGNNDTLVNSGTIVAGYFTLGYNGAVVVDGSGVSVTNASSGYLHATGDVDGIIFGKFGTLTNDGLITGGSGPSGDSPDGVVMFRGGLVINSGTIAGGGIYAGTYGSNPGTVLNSGLILGDSVYGGIKLAQGGTITNSGGTIAANGAAYGINIAGGAGTITNAGTIAGSVTLASGYANRVIFDPGAVFSGQVDGGGAILELGSGASTGTLSAVASNFTNFSELTLDSGSKWVIDGDASLSSEFGTISGFAATDEVQLSGHDTLSSQAAVGGDTHVTLTGASPMTLNFAGTGIYFRASYAGGVTTLTGVAEPLLSTRSNRHSRDSRQGEGMIHRTPDSTFRSLSDGRAV